VAALTTAGPRQYGVVLGTALLRFATLWANHCEADASPGRTQVELSARVLGVLERLVPVFESVCHRTGLGFFADDLAREGVPGRGALALEDADLEDDRPPAAVADAAVQGHLQGVAERDSHPVGESEPGRHLRNE